MSIGNGNGKRKSKTALTEPAQTSEQLEEMLTEKAAVEQPDETIFMQQQLNTDEIKAATGQPVDMNTYTNYANDNIKGVDTQDQGAEEEKTAIRSQSGGEDMVSEVVAPQPNIDAFNSSSPADEEKKAATGQPQNPKSTSNGEPEQDHSTTAEELLRAAKAATRGQSESQASERSQQQEPSQNDGSGLTTTSNLLDAATAQAAQGLVKASEEAQQAFVEMGVRDAQKDIRGNYLKAYQATVLDEIASVKNLTTADLSEQLELLRSHVDATTSDGIGKILSSLNAGEEKKKISPLENQPKAMDKLKII